MPGLILGSTGLFAILLGVTQASNEATHVSALLWLVTGMLILWLFIRRNGRQPYPLFSLALLGDPLLRYAMLVYQCPPAVISGRGPRRLNILPVNEIATKEAIAQGNISIPVWLAEMPSCVCR